MQGQSERRTDTLSPTSAVSPAAPAIPSSRAAIASQAVNRWSVPRSTTERRQGTEPRSGPERSHRYFGRVQTMVSIDYRDRKQVKDRDHSQSVFAKFARFRPED